MKKLAKKQAATKKIAKKTPAPESLMWYRAEWARMSKDHLPEAIIVGLAQLSYENKRLRERVAALEAIGLAQMFGKVEIDGVFHLLECRKREDATATCTCGSLPEETSARASNRN